MYTPFHKYFFILFLLLRVAPPAFSQNENDSIQKIIDSKRGLEKCEYLISLSRECRSKGDNERALMYSEQVIKTSSTNSVNSFEGSAYNELGLIYYSKLDFDKSIKNYLKSLELSEQIGDLPSQCAVLDNIGDVYRSMRNYSKSIDCHDSALNIAKKINDAGKMAASENSLAAVYYDMNELEKSLFYFKSAMMYYKSVNDLTNVGYAENNIGSIYNELNKYEDAIANYKNAMDIFSQQKDSVNYSMCLANIGNVYNVSGDYKQGIAYSLKGLEIASRLKDKSVTASCYVFLAEGYQKSGDYKNALAYQTKLLDIKDTIYDLQTNQNIAEMQTRYDTEKKEKENQILKQQNDLQNLSINRQRIINYSITLGLILVLMLAFYIYRGYKQKQKANFQLEEKNILIEEKNKIVEEKNKDITDSIRYAKRLQSAILKPEQDLVNYFPENFILFKPKDIVSGDFYWFEKFGNLTMVAAADCTGHGVPGAFMSIIGCNLLSQAVNEYAITHPGAILNSLNKGISKVLQQKNDENSVKDGMDVALFAFDETRMIVEYAGAYNSMWIVHQEKLTEYKADKFPIGAFVGEDVRQFQNHEIPVQSGDIIYVFSDGYADQFGGTNGKKFKYKPLQNKLIEIHKEPFQLQKLLLEKTLLEWMGKLEQVDDILIIGVKIP